MPTAERLVVLGREALEVDAEHVRRRDAGTRAPRASCCRRRRPSCAARAPSPARRRRAPTPRRSSVRCRLHTSRGSPRRRLVDERLRGHRDRRLARDVLAQRLREPPVVAVRAAEIAAVHPEGERLASPARRDRRCSSRRRARSGARCSRRARTTPPSLPSRTPHAPTRPSVSTQRCAHAVQRRTPAFRCVQLAWYRELGERRAQVDGGYPRAPRAGSAARARRRAE